QEVAFWELGNTAEASPRAAAAAGTPRLKAQLQDVLQLVRSHGREAVLAALERATHFGRFGTHDLRSILASGPARAADEASRGPASALTRSPGCAPAAVGELPMVTAAAEQLDPELVGRLRRLKLRRIREVAGEGCLPARTQPRRPQELPRGAGTEGG